jgi:hypothetical protein
MVDMQARPPLISAATSPFSGDRPQGLITPVKVT